MKSIIISFDSRNSVMMFARILSKFSIPSRTVNTPRVLNMSCGLCVKTDYFYLKRVINILNNTKISGFNGVYLYIREQTREIVERIF